MAFSICIRDATIYFCIFAYIFPTSLPGVPPRFSLARGLVFTYAGPIKRPAINCTRLPGIPNGTQSGGKNSRRSAHVSPVPPQERALPRVTRTPPWIPLNRDKKKKKIFTSRVIRRARGVAKRVDRRWRRYVNDFSERRYRAISRPSSFIPVLYVQLRPVYRRRN